MSYLGDAEVGEGVNIGAGTITANYDGTNKHRTTIGDGAFIGVDTMIVAPRDIGEGRPDRRRGGRHPGRARPASWRSASRRASASHGETRDGCRDRSRRGGRRAPRRNPHRGDAPS